MFITTEIGRNARTFIFCIGLKMRWRLEGDDNGEGKGYQNNENLLWIYMFIGLSIGFLVVGDDNRCELRLSRIV
jgi:hypothetical protein